MDIGCTQNLRRELEEECRKPVLGVRSKPCIEREGERERGRERESSASARARRRTHTHTYTTTTTTTTGPFGGSEVGGGGGAGGGDSVETAKTKTDNTFFLDNIQTNKRFKITLFIRIKHNMQIFGVIAFVKLQNDT